MDDFKVQSASEKNSVVLGRILIVCHPDINEILNIIAAKDVIYLDQNSKWLCKKPEFLSAAYYYYKKISVRHKWNNAEILLAYRGQSKVEYVFRNLKNPYHMAIRPQYHWTDQKK